jgi:hypothetical protein
MSDRGRSYSYEGPLVFWDNESFDGGRFFEIPVSPHYPELDQEIADALGIDDRDHVYVRVTVERV